MNSKYINFKNNIDYNELKKIANEIKNNKVVIFPTETVYGIGANGLDEEAIKKLFVAKKRPENKPINLLISNINMIENVAKDLTQLDYALIKEFFPGPLTLILKKKNNVPNILTANGDTVGVRMPANEISLKLIEYANIPIATSSSNISGNETGINIDNIFDDFNGRVDYIIDDGPSKLGVASTIVKVVDNKPIILREGSITKEQIETVYNNLYKQKN